MKKIIVLAVLALLISTSAYAAQTWTWNFDDGTWQGWTVIADPQAAPSIAANPYGGSLSAFLPGYNGGGDSSRALMAVAETNSFTFSADVTWGASNILQAAGLAYNIAATGTNIDVVDAWFEGKSNTSDRLLFKDTKTLNSATIEYSGLLKKSDGTGYQTPGAIRMTIDYNNEVAGYIVLKMSAYNYNPIAGTPWQVTYAKALQNDPNTGQIYTINGIRLGGAYSWSQPYYDNVTFTDYTVIPEPGSMIALGSGLVGLLGFAIRRRK